MSIRGELRERLNEHAPEYYAEEKEGIESNDACKAIGLDTMGFDAVGAGSGRSVFDMDILGHSGLVLKLATPHPTYDGLQQNKREIRLWNTASPDEKEFLAPIIAHGKQDYWLVMPKGTDVDILPYDWKLDMEHHLRDKVWEDDLRNKNVVRINGDLKLCDYGTPPQ